MTALEIVMAEIESKGVATAYDIVRMMGPGTLNGPHERMVRAAAYEVVLKIDGEAAMDRLMDEVEPGWRD